MPGKKMPPNSTSVRSQAVGFGLGQGLNVFEPADIADAILMIALKLHCVLKKVKTPPWAEKCRPKLEVSVHRR